MPRLDTIIAVIANMRCSDFNSEIFYDTIRANIKKYRVQQKLTAAQLAEKAGLGHDYLRQIESEKDRHHVSLVSLYKISQALGVKMDDLVEHSKDNCDE